RSGFFGPGGDAAARALGESSFAAKAPRSPGRDRWNAAPRPAPPLTVVLATTLRAAASIDATPYSTGSRHRKRGPSAVPSEPMAERARPSPDHCCASKQAPKDAARDPVCGMSVRAESPHRTVHEGKAYLFCGARCREKFEADPQHYLHPPAAEPERAV